MHINTETALAWLDLLREGVENSNSLAEETVTKAMAANALYEALKECQSLLNISRLIMKDQENRDLAFYHVNKAKSALAKARGETS